MSFLPWRRKQLGQYIEFFPSDSVSNKEIYGYDMQRRAAQAIGRAVLEEEECFVLFFGIPGTGKSQFPYHLAYTLNHDLGSNYSLMYAKCDELLGKVTSGQATPNDVIQELESKKEEAWENAPSIVVYDEIDSLSVPISGSEVYAATLTRWIRTYSKEAPNSVLTVGITNWPNVVDFSVLRRIRVNLFFGVASPEIIGRIIEENLGINDFREVAEQIWKGLEKNARIPLASDIVGACQQLKKRRAEPEKMSTKDLCEDLTALTGGSPRDMIDKYLRDFEGLINKAEEQMKYWEREWETLCKPLLKGQEE